MRLSNVDRGNGIKHKLLFGVIRLFSGFRAPDVVRTLFYRQPFFGAHHSRHTQVVMRGASEWTIGERELFAAFVSKMNQCSF